MVKGCVFEQFYVPLLRLNWSPSLLKCQGLQNFLEKMLRLSLKLMKFWLIMQIVFHSSIELTLCMKDIAKITKVRKSKMIIIMRKSSKSETLHIVFCPFCASNVVDTNFINPLQIVIGKYPHRGRFTNPEVLIVIIIVCFTFCSQQFRVKNII